LRNLLRKDQEPDLAAMILRVIEGFRFLDHLSEAEALIARDQSRRNQDQARELTSMLANVR